MTRPATADPTSCRWPSRPPGPVRTDGHRLRRLQPSDAASPSATPCWTPASPPGTPNACRTRCGRSATSAGATRAPRPKDGLVPAEAPATWTAPAGIPPGTVPSRGGQRGLHQLRRRRRPGGLVAALWRHPLRGRRPQGPNPGPPGRHGRVGQDGDLLQRHRHRSTTTTTTVAPTTHGGAHHHRGADHDDRGTNDHH